MTSVGRVKVPPPVRRRTEGAAFARTSVLAQKGVRAGGDPPHPSAGGAGKKTKSRADKATATVERSKVAFARQILMEQGLLLGSPDALECASTNESRKAAERYKRSAKKIGWRLLTPERRRSLSATRRRNRGFRSPAGARAPDRRGVGLGQQEGPDRSSFALQQVFDGPPGGQNDRQPRAHRAEPLRELEPVEAGQHGIRDHEVDSPREGSDSIAAASAALPTSITWYPRPRRLSAVTCRTGAKSSTRRTTSVPSGNVPSVPIRLSP